MLSHKRLDIANGLTGTVHVFDQPYTDMSIAVLAKTNAGGNGNLCLAQKKFRKFV